MFIRCAIKNSCLSQILGQDTKNDKNEDKIDSSHINEINEESKNQEYTVENTNCWSYPYYPCCENCKNAQILSEPKKNQYLGWENDSWCGIPEECF